MKKSEKSIEKVPDADYIEEASICFGYFSNAGRSPIDNIFNFLVQVAHQTKFKELIYFESAIIRKWVRTLCSCNKIYVLNFGSNLGK